MARHEAGHAVAALHYKVGLISATVKVERLGKMRVGGHVRHLADDQEPRTPTVADLIVALCGPLAENPWEDYGFHSEAQFDRKIREFLQTVADFEDGRLWKHANAEERTLGVHETYRFIKRRPVQEQIARAAEALLARTTLTASEVRAASGFTRSLRSRDFPR